eukprot:TRINITY_DN107_c0_g2_i7.p1 TRINITY_DN107_c0_g2~~TRINITY_DN107_c0_g2_i7.p1  ORF type:complete len:391 (-),score=215.13 TRINITY_DN107_c0_g2_i7:164-1336(-)
MKTNTVNLAKLLSVSIDCAQRAATIIRNVWFSKDLGICQKAPNDIYTRADVEVQQMLIGALLNIWPNLPIVAEENCVEPFCSFEPNQNLLTHIEFEFPNELKELPINEICIFIDPLDATKEFTQGNLSAVLTMIGISLNGRPIAGVINQPFAELEKSDSTGSLVWGIVGWGIIGIEHFYKENISYYIGELTNFNNNNNNNNNNQSIILTTTRSNWSPIVQQLVNKISPDLILKAGGAGYKLLLVVCGIANVYAMPGASTCKWDTCASEALALAAGAILTDISGVCYVYTQNCSNVNQNGVVVSKNLDIHVQIISKLNLNQCQSPTIKKQLPLLINTTKIDSNNENNNNNNNNSNDTIIDNNSLSSNNDNSILNWQQTGILRVPLSTLSKC